MKTRADAKQPDFIESNGKLYINIEQTEITKVEDEITSTFWEMETIEIDDKRNAPSIVKAYKLANIIVTLEDGTRFYANNESRTDISDAVSLALDMGATEEATIDWKTPDGIKTVTLAQLKLAKRAGLEAKARIIGVAI